MKEKKAIAVITILIIALFLAKVPFAVPPLFAEDWPQVQYDAQHSGYYPQTILPPTAPSAELWRWSGAPISIRVQPIIAGGFVFLPSNDGKLYAINKTTGQTAWIYTTPSGKPLVASAAYDNGLVFFGSTDHYIYAVDATTHNLRWRYQTGNSIRSAPTVANNTVFTGSTDGKMYALDATTSNPNGNLRWSYDIGAPILDTAAYFDNKVFFGGMNSIGYALNSSDGNLVWSKQLYGQGVRDRWTVAGNGKVIFTTMPYYPPVTRLADGTSLLHDLWSQGIHDWSTQREAIRTHLQNDPFLRSTYVLDANTGEETYTASILYISGGSTSAPSQPILSPNGKANVIYRWTQGIEPLWGQTTNNAIFLGEMNLADGDITQLDDWGSSDSNGFDQAKHIPFISDESSALMRTGDIIYIDSSRGTVAFDLATRRVIPFVSNHSITGGAYYNPPIKMYPAGHWTGVWDGDWVRVNYKQLGSEQWSDSNDYKRPTAVADDTFYILHHSLMVAVKGIKR